MGQQFRRRRIHDIASPMMVPRRKRSGGCGAREASPNATPEPKMLWQLLFRRLLRYRMGASLHMLPQGARVTCYLGAPMSFFIPGRACHMLPCGPDPRKCSSHRGYPLFNGARAALRSVQRACDRERSRPDARDDIVADRELLMSEARPRRVQGDAESSGNCIAFLQPRAFQRLAGAHHGEREAGCE